MSNNSLKLKNHSTLTLIMALAPFVIALIIFGVRIETRLTRIETDISWIKDSYKQCQQILEKVTR